MPISIVDDHCQLIGVNTVAAPQDDIAAFSSQVLRIRTIMSVDKADSSIRKPQPLCRVLVRAFGSSLFGCQMAAGTGV